MASQVEIVNMALLALGEYDFILAMDENTKAARLASLAWNITKKKVLEDHPWKFATKRTNLSPLTTAPEYEYSAVFQLPADFIRITEVSDGIVPITDYETSGNTLLANASVIYLKYVCDITNTELFTPSFANCLSIYLAHKLAYSITSSRTKEEQALQLYIKELGISKENDAQSATPKGYEGDTLWVEAVRYGGGT